MIFLMIVLSLNTVSAIDSRSTSVQYLGSVKYSYYTVGKFKVNGDWAFCVDHAKASPPTGTSYDSGYVYSNDSIRAILYYGYDGAGSILPQNDATWVATSLALAAVTATEVVAVEL